MKKIGIQKRKQAKISQNVKKRKEKYILIINTKHVWANFVSTALNVNYGLLQSYLCLTKQISP